jgi:outer membrane protein TolC
MGLGSGGAAELQVSDGFPTPAQVSLPPHALAERALEARRDLQSAQASVAAAGAALEGADHNTLPALDLSLSVGYSGALAEDGVGPFFEAAGTNVEGVNAGASLTLELPIENTAQRSERALQSAFHRSATIARDDLARNVRTQVLSALDALRLTAEALEAARLSEEQYRQALDDEREKLRAGLSTVIDVVLTEERLTEAQRARVRNEANYAIALAQLRLQLGELPSSEAQAGVAMQGVLDPRNVRGE